MAKLTLGIVVKSLFGSDLPPEARGIAESMPAVPDTVGERLNSLLHIPSWGPTRRNLHERRVRMKQLRDEMMTLFLAGC